jgi:hypothetical protein
MVACATPALAPVQTPASVKSPAAEGETMGAHADDAVTFEDDEAFLSAYGDVQTLESPGGGRVAVSAKYQGRVMTSAVAPGGRSLGFVHRKFIEAGKTGTAFDNYGGEDRFWLGPEGGQFGLYFPKGSAFTFDKWQTPSEMQEGAWTIARRTSKEIAFTRTMRVTNVTGTAFTVDVARTVRMLEWKETRAFIDAPINPDLGMVAFESENQITNAGDQPWKQENGLLSAWILGMFAPAPDATIIVPFYPGGSGPIVNDRYFGKVPPDRLKVHDERTGYVLLKADGKYRSKIGIGPSRVMDAAGSYSPSENLLTIVQYDDDMPGLPRAVRQAGMKRVPLPNTYVNSMWETQTDPYGGDVINAYNDGPTEPGKPSLGGFYELETSSPAAALAPRASLTHTHRTFHFVGPRGALEPIAKKVLGVSLDDVTR